ncbi:MAG TPA: hypothetical protein VMW87_10400, partial [Spirochaetia bacterium]|nr:hypothetical protein [Spirochaetia bacterium]
MAGDRTMEESKAFVPDTVTKTVQSQPLPDEAEGGGERRSHKGLKVFLVLSLAVLLAVGAAAAYAYYLNLPVKP